MNKTRKSKTKSTTKTSKPDQPGQMTANKEKVLPDIRLLCDDTGNKHFFFG